MVNNQNLNNSIYMSNGSASFGSSSIKKLDPSKSKLGPKSKFEKFNKEVSLLSSE